MSERVDTVIVGAGLAGLACALELTEAGYRVLVLEESDDVGGRMRTDVVDGFRLDRGFQVLLDSYPEVKLRLDAQAIGARYFEPGAMIWNGRRIVRVTDPWRRPRTVISSMLSGVATFGDLRALSRLRKEIAHDDGTERLGEPTTARYIAAYGFSKQLLQQFLIPFFSGVFLTRDLEVPSSRFRFYFRMFMEGRALLPAEGIGAYPRYLASKLPDDCIRLRSRVVQVDDGEVRCDDGSSVTARAVVVATDAISVAELIPGRRPLRMRGGITLYFTAGKRPLDAPYLLLNGTGGGIIDHLCEISTVQPAYAPPGETLVSVSVLAADAPPQDEELEEAVRRELSGMFGKTVERWTLLRIYRVPFALPVLDGGGCPIRPPGTVRTYLCGDYTLQPSINGALASGAKTARTVAGRLRGTAHLTA